MFDMRLLLLFFPLLVCAAPNSFVFPKHTTQRWGLEIEYQATLYLEPIYLERWIFQDTEHGKYFDWYRCLHAKTRADQFEKFEELKRYYTEDFINKAGGHDAFERLFPIAKENPSFQHYQPELLTLIAEHSILDIKTNQRYLVLEFVHQLEERFYFNRRDISPSPYPSGAFAVDYVVILDNPSGMQNYYVPEESFLENFQKSTGGLSNILTMYSGKMEQINAELLLRLAAEREDIYTSVSDDAIICDLILSELVDGHLD